MLKFSIPVDDPVVINRIAGELRDSGGELEKIDPALKVIAEKVLATYSEDVHNEALDELLNETLTTGKYDFYQGFVMARILLTNGIHPKYDDYPLFSEFVRETGKSARLIQQMW